MPKPTKRPDGAIAASSIQADLCEHGALTLYLYDDGGNVFAVAVMGIDEALAFSLDLTGQLSEYGRKIGAITRDEMVH